MIAAFYATIAVSIIGLLIATYTDLKERIVPNKLNYSLAILGILIYGAQSIIEGSYLPITYSLLGMGFGFLFAYALWKIGVFAGGDVKLFMGLGALNPFTPAIINFGVLAKANAPLFPVTLFVYSLIAFLPYGFFVLSYKILRNKKIFEQLRKETKQNLTLAAHASLFASAAYALLAQFPFVFVTTAIAILAWGAFRENKKFLTVAATIASAILSPALFAQALLGAIIISVGGYTAIKIMLSSRRVLSSEVEVSKLQEGMIPAKSIYLEKGKITQEKPLDLGRIMLLAKQGGKKALQAELGRLFSGKEEVISSRKARGLTVGEIKEVKKLAAQGKIPKKMLIKESMPFVPTMLLGYLLCMLLGDLVWLLALH